jgi:hypothetical protein
LKSKALEFERRNAARTYLILDNAAVQRGGFVIVAYFTLANKPLVFGEKLSKSAIKAIDGFSKNVTSVGSIIIGQLGKDDVYGRNIKGSEIIDSAMEWIYDAAEIIGGRIVFLECRDETKLVDFYSRNGFTYLQTNPSSGLLQLVRRL